MEEQNNIPSETPQTPEIYKPSIDLDPINDKISALHTECAKVLVGQEELVELILTAILCGGHVLLEGVPGIAKTLTAKVLSRAIDTDFSRIQFTPDLMPSDIIGTSIFNLKKSKFVFQEGPIFSNMILIDEINRAPAKTQAALFEVMEENQITFDGTTYPMSFPFVVIATQNPIEQEGTYRLPEGQLDRFLMKINLTYPSHEEEIDILTKYKDSAYHTDLETIDKVLSPEDLQEMMDVLKQIHIEDQIIKYISDIIQLTRSHGQIYLGASPRAGLAMLRASKVTAMLAGRDFVIPDDVQHIAPYVLNHRIILSPAAEMEGYTTTALISEMLKTVEVPR